MNRRLQLLAGILSYPRKNYKELVNRFTDLGGGPIQKEGRLQIFRDFVNGNSLTDIEELFTTTFDMNKDTCLEIGWHLYGEDYNRGDFLVKMRQALQEFNIAESGELPDHLSHCLLLLAALEPPEARIFAGSYISKALDKILSGLNEVNPYFALLQSLKIMLQKCDYQLSSIAEEI